MEQHEPIEPRSRRHGHSSSSSKRRFNRHDEQRETTLVDVVEAMEAKKASKTQKASRQRTTLHCPVCVNDFLCHSRKRRLKHKLLGLIGVKILRCEHCNRRYYRFRV